MFHWYKSEGNVHSLMQIFECSGWRSKQRERERERERERHTHTKKFSSSYKPRVV